MRCPHCNIGIRVDFDHTYAYRDQDYDETGTGVEIGWDFCPECDELIIRFCKGQLGLEGFQGNLDSIDSEHIVYPLYTVRPVEPEVPQPYRDEYLEASAILTMSPKASAALSRRILQMVLRDIYQITHPSLAAEIDTFINQPNVPSYLTEAIDAIRNVGNFAAHPLKDTNTGEVVAVEPGEAEWLLEVLDALFDFAFVQPIRLAERKKNLNQKLTSLGKPAMKG